jgi:hypothetical protein
MNKLIPFIVLLFCVPTIHCQPNGDKILKEGQLLFRSEKASWYGTDEFLSRFPNLKDSIGGYLSYEGDDHHEYNIFISRENPFRILARLEFDSLPKEKPIYIDMANKSASQKEKDLIIIRQDALDKIRSNSDHFFSFYKNTSFNLIPVISQSERKVYIITGPQNSGVVIIGNDYLLKYDSKNNFISKEKVHNSMIQLPAKNDTINVTATMHSHVISDVIDPTDICSLLLYKDFVDWKQHYVISKKYVSIFELDKQKLTILTRKAWDKISKIKK